MISNPLSHNFTLVTNNARELARAEGLQLGDWEVGSEF
jgi:predicted nucleic acid-binding protein